MNLRSSLSVALCAAALLFAGCSGKKTDDSSQQQLQPTVTTPRPAVAVPAFDGKNAFSYLTAQCDFGPRNPGSQGHRNCLSYLHDEMNKYADAVNLQEFTMQGYKNEQLNLTNVIASFNSQATKRVVLIAHWDTRPRADQEKDKKKQEQPIIGANDGASGVAICLELSRLFKASPPPIGVDVVFVDAEDYGKEGDSEWYLLGARYFAKHLQPGYAPAFGILLDMVGDKDLELKRERYSTKYAPDIVDLVWGTARELGVTQFSDEYQNWVMDDHLPLNEVGIKTIDLIDFAYPDTSNQYWHTHNDTPDKCSAESLEAVGKVLATVIYRQTAE